MQFTDEKRVAQGLGTALDYSLKIHQLRKKQQYQEALACAKQALELLSNFDDLDSLAISSRFVLFFEEAGSLEEKLGHYQAALRDYKMARKLSERIERNVHHCAFEYDRDRNAQNVQRIESILASEAL